MTGECLVAKNGVVVDAETAERLGVEFEHWAKTPTP